MHEGFLRNRVRTISKKTVGKKAVTVFSGCWGLPLLAQIFKNFLILSRLRLDLGVIQFSTMGPEASSAR
jgi:hypothetical protein